MYTEERITQLDPHRRYPFLGALVYAMMIEMIPESKEMMRSNKSRKRDDLQEIVNRVLNGYVPELDEPQANASLKTDILKDAREIEAKMKRHCEENPNMPQFLSLDDLKNELQIS